MWRNDILIVMTSPSNPDSPLPLAPNFISLCNKQYENKQGCQVDVPCYLLSTEFDEMLEKAFTIPGVGNLFVVLCRSNVAKSLSVKNPPKPTIFLYTTTETLT